MVDHTASIPRNPEERRVSAESSIVNNFESSSEVPSLERGINAPEDADSRLYKILTIAGFFGIAIPVSLASTYVFAKVIYPIFEHQ